MCVATSAECGTKPNNELELRTTNLRPSKSFPITISAERYTFITQSHQLWVMKSPHTIARGARHKKKATLSDSPFPISLNVRFKAKEL